MGVGSLTPLYNYAICVLNVLNVDMHKKIIFHSHHNMDQFSHPGIWIVAALKAAAWTPSTTTKIEKVPIPPSIQTKI